MLRVYDALLPAERPVSTLGLLLPRSPAELKTRLMGDMLSAVDVPGSLASLATDRKSTRLNSSHQIISYAVFCLKKKKTNRPNSAASIAPNVLKRLDISRSARRPNESVYERHPTNIDVT